MKNQLFLPYYDVSSRSGGRLRNKIHRNKVKYGIITKKIPNAVLCVQNGEKYCKTCGVVKNIKYFRYFINKRTKHGQFRNYCNECEVKRSKKYKETYKEKYNLYQKNVRLKILKKIQDKIECVRCGCNDIRLLEINHKYGGGNKEHKKHGGNVAQHIYYNHRTMDDLELLCKPCNIIHYLEIKYNQKIPMKVIWK